MRAWWNRRVRIFILLGLIILVIEGGVIALVYHKGVIPFPPKTNFLPPVEVQVTQEPGPYSSGHNWFTWVNNGMSVPLPLTVWDTYFTVTKDCKNIYFSRGEDGNVSSIRRYDAATGLQYRMDLTSLPEGGTVYRVKLSPDERMIGGLDTYPAREPSNGNSVDRGVILMLLQPSLSPAWFIYDPVGTEIADFRWAKDGKSIGVEEWKIGSSVKSIYTDVRILDGGRSEVTSEVWESDYLKEIALPDDDASDRRYYFVDPNQAYKVDVTYGEFSASSVTATCPAS